MGLLDDLKNQAENEKVSQEENTSRQAEGEQFYQEELRPRLLKVFQFFNQLVAHLNALKMETIVEYPLLPGGNLQKLRQQGYKVLIDSSKAPKKIDFTMECVLDAPVEFEIEGGTAVQSHTDFLQRFAIRHQRNDKKGPGQQVVSAKFILHGPIPVKATIEADVEAAGLRLTIRNFTQPGYIKYPLKAEQLTDAFLDKLGGFIIRKEANLFGSQEISEEAKQKLREKILAEQRMRDQEMVEAEKRREAEKLAEKDNSSKEQLKQTVNSKVSQGKESLKGMFNRLKKQAGFGSGSTETTLPSDSAAVKPQAPAQKVPVRPAPVAPKPQASTQQAPVQQPASVMPKQSIPKPSPPAAPASAPASTKPTATQAHASPAMAKSDKQTAAPPPAPPGVSIPKAPEPPPVPAAARKSQPPKIYKAPGSNPFLPPDLPEVSSDPGTPLGPETLNPEESNLEKLNSGKLNSELKSDPELKLNPEPKQVNNDSENKPGFEPAAATAPPPSPSLTPDDLGRELANFMEPDVPEPSELKIPEEKSKPVPPAETLSPDPLLASGALDFDLSVLPTQVNADSEKEPSPVATSAEAPESGLTLEPVESDTNESLTLSEEEPSPTPTVSAAPESSLTLEPVEPDTDASLKPMFPDADKAPEEKS